MALCSSRIAEKCGNSILTERHEPFPLLSVQRSQADAGLRPSWRQGKRPGPHEEVQKDRGGPATNLTEPDAMDQAARAYGVLLHFPVSAFPHLEDGCANSVYLTGLGG